jgi:hypothetical protein
VDVVSIWVTDVVGLEEVVVVEEVFVEQAENNDAIMRRTMRKHQSSLFTMSFLLQFDFAIYVKAQ